MSEMPATKVVQLFGGPKAVADILGISTTQVYRWSHPKEKQGADGQVPHKHHQALLIAAEERGITLTPQDLMPWLAKSGEAA